MEHMLPVHDWNADEHCSKRYKTSFVRTYILTNAFKRQYDFWSTMYYMRLRLRNHLYIVSGGALNSILTHYYTRHLYHCREWMSRHRLCVCVAIRQRQPRPRARSMRILISIQRHANRRQPALAWQPSPWRLDDSGVCRLCSAARIRPSVRRSCLSVFHRGDSV